MKIALLTLSGAEFTGGVEKFNDLLIRALESGKHKVKIFAFRDLKLSITQSTILKILSKTPYSGIYKAFLLNKEFKKHQKDFGLVIANDFFGMFVKNIKQILIFHGYYEDIFNCMKDRVSPLYRIWGGELARVQRMSLKNADLVVTPSQRNFDYLKSKGLKVDKVIEHGIDTDFYKPTKNFNSLKSFKLPKNFLLSVGTRAPWKNFEIVKEASKDFDVVVISPKEKVGNIKFLEGVDDSLMPDLYSKAIVLLHPSLHEGFGYVVAEAMACGTPVLFSKTGFGPEIGKTLPELIVENPKDYSEVKKKLEFIISNRKTLSQKSRAYILKHNNLKDWTKKWLEFVK